MISLILIIGLICATVTFLERSEEIEFEESQEELLLTATNNINTINLFFKEFIRVLEIGANMLQHSDDILSEEGMEIILNDVKNTGDFLSVSINSQSGESFSLHQSILSLYPKYLARMESGEVIISDILYDERLQQDVIGISVPIFTGNEGQYYYLNGDISVQKISNILNESFRDTDIYFHLLDSDMNYISTSENNIARFMNTSFEEAIGKLCFTDGITTADVIFDSFKTLKGGFASYNYGSEIDDEGRYLYYLPVGINNWMYWLLVPKTVIDNDALTHSKNSMEYLFTIVIILVVMFILITIRVLQLSTRSKEVQKAVDIFAEQTKKIIFEWKWKLDSGKKVTNYTSFSISNRNILLHQNIFENIYSEDIEVMQSAFDILLRGYDTTNLVIRLLDKARNPLWFSLSTTTLKNKKGKFLKIYGFLENVDSTIRHTEKLTQNIKKDPLTKLYNKKATEDLIVESLNTCAITKSALFFIDFDNFKQINDNLSEILAKSYRQHSVQR